MSAPGSHVRQWLSSLAVAAAAPAVLFLAAACASGGDAAGKGQEGFRKVTSSDRVYTIDDLAQAGFRTSAEYDIEGLPKATAA
ncbi:MAG: hypothetical protein FJ313_07420, partial [Gemmatimonadetes bacterium]|nr:hypothetical protein [Gemmatimonadota bacterium]